MNTLDQAVVIIVGAAGGVGRALAMALAKGGATLVLVDRDAIKLEVTKERLGIDGHNVTTHTADITKEEDVARLTHALQNRFGAIDCLIHSAGFIKLAPLGTASMEDFDQHYQVNARAPYRLTQLLLPGLIARQGQVVFLNSTLGLTTKAGASQYAATKHALKAVADTLRAEVNNQGVRVLSVFLGSTATPMQETVRTYEGVPYHSEHLLQPEDVAALVVHLLNLPRTAEVTDIHLRSMRKPR